MPLSNSTLASGEASAESASAKSRVPASMTDCPGKNFRVAGFGVCSVRISIPWMWRFAPLPARERESHAWRSSFLEWPSASTLGKHQNLARRFVAEDVSDDFRQI